MLKKILILSVMLLATTSLWAQPHHELGSVGGIVSLHNGSPAVGATVRVLGNFMGPPLEATTGNDGSYLIDSVWAGPNWIEASLEGQQNVGQPIMVAAGPVTTVNLAFGGTLDEQGSVAGTVSATDGTPVNDADVMIDGGDPMHGHHGVHLRTETDAQGAFSFPHVPAGTYNVFAMLEMRGFASTTIDVVANQTTNVTLVLSDSSNHGGGGGHHHGDTLTVVELSGTAIVLPPDSTHRQARYFLDVDSNGVTPEYRLAFGPPWYDPGNGAHRPANGDVITISGGLFTYTHPPLVVVYMINGLQWRPQFHGHGGNGGGDHHHDGCNPDSVTRVELQGTAVVRTMGGFHGDMAMYAI
jgi:hypothetical protein